MNTQYLNLNMVPNGVFPVMYVSQYDIGRPMGFNVYASGGEVDLSSYTATIEGTRTDNVAVVISCTIDGNSASFESTATMTNVAGKYNCQLVIRDGDDRIASLPFKVFVQAAAMDENSEEIEEDASLFEQYTSTVNATISAEQAARVATDNALDDKIDSLVGDEWDSSTVYTKGQLAISNNTVYRAKVGTVPVGTAVTNTTYWEPTTLATEVGTLNSGISVIGTIQNNAGDAPVTNATFTTVISLTLDAGTWIVIGSGLYTNSTSNGIRILMLDVTESDSNSASNSVLGTGRCDLSKTRIMSSSSSFTVYLRAYQTSNTTLTCNGHIIAVRIK